MSGTLYLCATPIGNREDITLRALRVLREADVIAAEDTRRSRILLDSYEIKKPLVSYHEHNKYERAEELVGRLLDGENIALITDAGTPVISDPGEVLVIRAREAGIPVTALPGPCALVDALSLSGISGRRFAFEGFLPVSGPERREVLEALRREERTIILYEAPHRLLRTLDDLREVLGDRRVSVCRELTKIHEEVLSLTLEEAAAYYRGTEPRGEFVLVLAGRPAAEILAEKRQRWEDLSPAEHLQQVMAEGLDRKAALKRVAAERGADRRQLYRELFVEEKTE